MSYKRKDLPKSQVELEITVQPDEYQKFMVKGAERISNRVKIEGFRPGKAPYEIVKRQVGEMNIMQEALEEIVQSSFFEAVKAENLETVGMPKIDLDKMAPGNELTYKAVVSLLPHIELPDLKKISVKREVKEVTDTQVDEVVENLRKLQAKEVLKNDLATEADLLMIDMDMKIDNVPVDGGQAKNYRIYLSEDHYIPGFNKELVGLKKDDTKTFPITFPKTHYQKHLAGKKVDVTVKVHDVYERQFAELNEEFAKALGQDSMENLRALLRTNIGKEAEQKAEEKLEIEIFDAILAKTKISDLPDVLVEAEKKKMYYELTRDLDRSGIAIEDYLKDIKKTEEELNKDFTEQATKRAQAALVSRQVAKNNSITVSKAEVDAEVKMMEEAYHDNPEYIANLQKPEVRRTLETILTNKKVIQWLKQQVLA